MQEENTKITLKNQSFEIVENVKEAWDEEAFTSRYSDILNKYDYIVGDWGFEQLRMRGFYENSHKKASYDNKIETLQDYINEYCNFGCAYFVLKRQRAVK